MNHVGIICEFNPFHYGHEFLIQRVKRQFPEKGIICIMSGNFVQRGDFAVQEKYSRARCAVLAGADLVLELPFPFSCLSAESFGRSAVSILKSIAVCDTLAFGTEIVDRDRLQRCAKNLNSNAFSVEFSRRLKEKKGWGYPRLRQEVYSDLFGEEEVLSLPNASLALEYLIASEQLKYYPNLFCVERIGSRIDEDTVAKQGPSSASAIRNEIFSEGDWRFLVPEYVRKELESEQRQGHFPIKMDRLDSVLLYLLRMLPCEELMSFYGFSALSYRALRFVNQCTTVEELIQKMKNSTFTDSRIRRGLLSVLCRIPRYAEKEMPRYTELLAANQTGKRILMEIQENSDFPVFSRPADALKSDRDEVVRQALAAYKADEIYTMAFPLATKSDYCLKRIPFFCADGICMAKNENHAVLDEIAKL